MSLWPHQTEAVARIYAALCDGGRATAVAACGTGKTVIGAECSARLVPDGSVLVLVPTLELLSQTADSYAAHLGAGTGPIVRVCGDRKVTAGAEVTDLHAPITTDPAVADLAGDTGRVTVCGYPTAKPRSEITAPITTDPATVANLVGDAGRVTVFATYASLPVIVAAHTEYGLRHWDLVIVDEAHRTAGVKRQWARVHDDRHIPARRRLYLTATPRIMAATGDDSVSMDDATIFGPQVFQLPFATAIESGLLADYRVAVVMVTDAEIAELTSAGRVVQVAGRAVPARMLAMQIALAKAVRDYRLRRVITYHGRVSSATRFAAGLRSAIELLPVAERPPWPVRARWVSGDSSPRLRREALAGLRHPGAATAVVSNARVLAEGVDVPALDAVMFADPRDSATDVVQAVGRALRRGGDSGKIATIIVPIFLTEGENPQAALDGSEFDTVWRVVRALRAHDERIADYLDRRRRDTRALEPRHVEPMPSWLHVDGAPTRVGAEFHRSILLRTVRMTTSAWWENYAALLAFHAEHGHADVPSGYRTADGRQLGAWLTRCRKAYRAGNLPDERAQRLTDLGVQWHPLPARWETGIAALREFHAEHGHGNVPITYCAPSGFELGQWLRKRREYYKAASLSEEQVVALESFGVDWDPSTSTRTSRWTSGLAALRAYRAAHGHANIPVGFVTADGDPLGKWLYRRRTDYRAGTLPAERAAELRAEGVELTVEPWGEHLWRRHLEDLVAYRVEHGHADPPQRFTTSDGFRLGAWVSRCRADYRRGRLNADQISDLRALGVTLEPGNEHPTTL
ncbi:Helicase associated domain protein [Nocardia sp. R7R-8]|uniref:Helicase associated domain protein n=1 Tax=Nocardia sp. R7R-8 TaxID=3459304 RepID=UPI00403DF05F